MDFLALHDANLGEVLSNEVLTKRWVFLWKESRRKVGAPTVSSSAMHEKNSVNFLFYPFSQRTCDVFSLPIGYCLVYPWFSRFLTCAPLSTLQKP